MLSVFVELLFVGFLFVDLVVIRNLDIDLLDLDSRSNLRFLGSDHIKSVRIPSRDELAFLAGSEVEVASFLN